MEIFFSALIFVTSAVLGLLIRKRVIPPISMVYLTSTPKAKERHKNDKDVIAFISNVFFITGFGFFIFLLWLLYPAIKIFKYFSYVIIGLLLVYVIYKSISYEMNNK